MIRYVFKDDLLVFKGGSNANPQAIGEALEGISAKHGGQLTPHAVVDEAKNPVHPLHKHFEWDDSVAAAGYRLDQARAIIRVVRLDVGDDEPTRAFLSITDNAGTSYRPTRDIQNSVTLQALVLAQAQRDLDAFMKRYREMADICVHVQAAKDALARRASAEAAQRV